MGLFRSRKQAAMPSKVKLYNPKPPEVTYNNKSVKPKTQKLDEEKANKDVADHLHHAALNPGTEQLGLLGLVA